MSNKVTLLDVVAKIDELTSICPRSLERRGLKLAEEAGEVCRAIDIETDGPCTKYRERDPEQLLEECADVFIVMMSIVRHHKGGDFDLYGEAFTDMVMKKLGKWESILKSEDFTK